MALVEGACIPTARHAGSTPRAVVRGAVAITLAMLGLTVPGVAIAAVALLTIAYLVAAALLAATAFLRPNCQSSLGWQMREDVADLTAGGAAELWPLAAILVFVIVLGA